MSLLERMPVRVLIADDAEVIRKAIRDLLASEPTIEVCGEARTFCGVEVWRGGLGGTYRLPTLSSE